MANQTGDAPSTGFHTLQTAVGRRVFTIESWFERERNQIVLWFPVFFGTGIAAWFVFPRDSAWIAFIILGLAIAAGGLAIGTKWRTGVFLLMTGTALALGCAHIWQRSQNVAAQIVPRPVFSAIDGLIAKVEVQTAKSRVRLTIEPDERLNLPERIRVTIADRDLLNVPVAGDRVAGNARLVPPPEAAVPGSYDFARYAWFQGIGAIGKATGKVTIISAKPGDSGNARERLSSHIRTRLSGSQAGIAAALATGDQGGVSAEDQEAMRASGLAHLLSVSGLHITAVVAATMFLVLRLFALSPALALRWPLIVIAAGFGALAGIGYTLLTGSEVPTIRSCIAALLVLAGIAMGREALTLRLVATGATIVLIFWPESLVGPSFQLSFAAITAIVALHESAIVKRLTQRRDEGLVARILRTILSLLLTGLAVEIALAPIALFHFHKSGLYGALANIIAIPLTTFVIMPLEALALLFDVAGLGAPLWWLTGLSLQALLLLAHWVQSAPGAVALLPAIPIFAFGLMMGGGLWLLLWRSRERRWGMAPIIVGALIALWEPRPDMLVTGDGRHLAIADERGKIAILRPRTGDYVRNLLAERSAYADDLDDLDVLSGAKCSADVCQVRAERGTRVWSILATRSRHFLPWAQFIQQCAAADIVISDRRLPPACKPRWFKADRVLLTKTGGLAVFLAKGRVDSVHPVRDDHPWVASARNANAPFQYRRNNPASAP